MCSSRTDDSPIGFGRKGERVANTPIRTFPPSLGGRTVGLQPSDSENPQISQTCEYPSSPRRAEVGRGYDLSFLPDNEEQYCSELVWNSYLKHDGGHIFTAAPMNFKSADGSYPEYWVWLFSRIGMPIPQGVEGTNPNDMARTPILKPVGEL